MRVAANMAVWRNAIPSRYELYEAKREALLREAAAAFNRNGFHATSLDDIAHNLGLTKAALYHYFPNKQTLLSACFARAMEVAFLALHHAQTEGVNGRDKLIRCISFYVERMIDELSCCVVLLEENALRPADHALLVAERDRFEQALRALVREGIADGSIIACDPKLVIFAILGSINWIPKWFRHSGDWSSGDLTKSLMELFDRMLSTHPAAALALQVGGSAAQGP